MQPKKISEEEISAFCTSLAHLLHAGLSAADGLAFLAQDREEGPLGAVLQNLSRRVDAGESLGKALKNEGVFPAYVCTLVLAGEATGNTEEALFSLGDYYEKQERLKWQLRNAVMSPLLLLGILVLVLAVMLIWVLPIFDDVYRQLGSSLAGIAGGLLALGGLLRQGLPVILTLMLLGSGVLGWLVLSEEARKKGLAALERKHRGILARVNEARLAQVLAMALRSGLDSESALLLARELGLPGTEFERRIQDCIARVSGCTALPQALRECGLLQGGDARLLEAGFRGGCADTVMTKLADRLQESSEAQLERLLSRIEPALVLTASLLVGTVLLCVLLPLTRIMSLIG